jgi:uncharacterized protein (DUF4415 family)
MKTKTSETVRYEIDLKHLPPLTLRQKREIAALKAMGEDEINLDDIPPVQAVDGAFYRPIKQQITARVDADVLAWLKAQGRGYQARMNAILRREMLASLKARR